MREDPTPPTPPLPERPRAGGARRGRAPWRWPWLALLVGLLLAPGPALPPAEAAPALRERAEAKARPATRPAASRPTPGATRQAARAAPRGVARPARAAAARVPRQQARPAARAASRPGAQARRGPAARQAARPAPPPRTRPFRPAAPDAALLAEAREAAAATGIGADLLLAIAWRESRFDAAARNPLSSAAGLMQFTAMPWLEAIRDHGAAHGLAAEAALLLTDPQTGLIGTRRSADLRRLLGLRSDPGLSLRLAGARLAALRPGLEEALGRPPGPAEFYAAHLLGSLGARRFLREAEARPTRAAAQVVGTEAAARNRSIFEDRAGRRRSLAEVRAAFARSMAEGAALLPGAPPVVVAEAE